MSSLDVGHRSMMFIDTDVFMKRPGSTYGSLVFAYSVPIRSCLCGRLAQLQNSGGRRMPNLNLIYATY